MKTVDAHNMAILVGIKLLKAASAFVGGIEKKICLFEENKLDLFEIVRDLGGLLNALESVSESWKDDFQGEINTLEMIHDSIEDGSISRWKGNYKEDMHNAISKLKNMTVSILEEYLEKSDLNVLESATE